MAAVLIAAVLGIASPSGNIACFPLGGTLHCRIAQAAYRPRLQKQCAARASLDWRGFELAPGAGLTCTAGSHGIFISRRSWRGW